MKWDEFARQLTDAASGSGRCVFAAIHSAEDGTCLGRYPKDGQQRIPQTPSHIPFLNTTYPARLIGQGGSVTWPPRSPD
ncbi:hypothetical protein TNCV_422171 [Trichonephila clavipes]|nr:hypothetical protein TNCV_422171 [Trichonephila clavipes]